MSQGYCLSFLSVSEIGEMETSLKVKSEFLHFEPNKKICVVQVILLTLIFFTPYLILFFSPFWRKCSSEKGNGRLGMHFKRFFL